MAFDSGAYTSKLEVCLTINRQKLTEVSKKFFLGHIRGNGSVKEVGAQKGFVFPPPLHTDVFPMNSIQTRESNKGVMTVKNIPFYLRIVPTSTYGKCTNWQNMDILS